MANVVAVLEVMWDPRYAGRKAPPWFTINAENHTGKRLYDWLHAAYGYEAKLVVTNACPNVVANAKGKGVPDATWLAGNLVRLAAKKDGIDLLLVCGKVAEETFYETGLAQNTAKRMLILPHPAARQWTSKMLAFVVQCLRNGKSDLKLQFNGNTLKATELCDERLPPF